MALADLALPLLRRLDPETAHRLTIRALRAGLGPVQRGSDDPRLAVRVLGLDFANPVGLAAGFDKNAEVPGPALAQGFGFVEIGTVTPRPQAGNPRPRLFRLPADRAVINRNGFNNEGLEAAAARLAALRRSGPAGGPVGGNIGRNKDSADAAADYAACARRLGPLVDYLVINVSSPNTPGLRALQGRDALAGLVDAVCSARREATGTDRPPVLVKIAPDLTEEDRRDIAAVARTAPVDGLIVSNTTIARPDSLKEKNMAREAGGLSGAPLFAPSTALLAEMYRLTDGAVPLIGVGGIASGADAYAKIRAGASLVQLYTALIYQGPSLLQRIKAELCTLMERDGFTRIGAAIGADHR